MKKLLFASTGFIIYTFFGYPALLALWAWLRPSRMKTNSQFTPRVSLIIAAYNEADVIESKLQNCYTLDYPHELLEVIVVADGSDDQTAHIASKDTRVKVLFQPERKGKMAAIKRAVAVAKGDILVFSDANNLYLSTTLQALLVPFTDSTVGVVTGRKAIDDGYGRPLDRVEGLYWRYESKIKSWENQLGSVTGVAGEILAVRREAFRSPPDGTVNDDFVLAMLAAIDGWQVLYTPEAVSLEPASATMSDEVTRRSRIVTGRYQALFRLLPTIVRKRPRLAWQVVSHKGMRPLIPFAMLITGISNLLLIPQVRWASWLTILQGMFYASAILGWWAERKGVRYKWLYLTYYFCRMNSASIQGLHRFLRRGNHALWAKARRANTEIK